MNKLNSFQESSLEKKHSNEENHNDNESKDQQEKVLCNHCGRTSSNGIRCLGICVADNDY
ncbi:hypothetical protein [Prochlorococcus marinus]|uniref:Uncharacterized protein n=1 Tax=Prochlorococcus marinus XMU1408 TaxID=2213228 RepID=A0A318R0C1_PROMR|nr:hypothetical protein [Prochlorococcus marinus]MBW3042810.1 hypothetical protein [Prochlorococcus marinus str. XMU1408]PYE00637.1 hypothetical protein DNJ73_08825 [Prochlorococcus marinus XMU1408]